MFQKIYILFILKLQPSFRITGDDKFQIIKMTTDKGDAVSGSKRQNRQKIVARLANGDSR